MSGIIESIELHNRSRAIALSGLQVQLNAKRDAGRSSLAISLVMSSTSKSLCIPVMVERRGSRRYSRLDDVGRCQKVIRTDTLYARGKRRQTPGNFIHCLTLRGADWCRPSP